MSDADYQISEDRDEPRVSVFRFDNVDIEVTCTKCIDKMGPDENGRYDYYYDYELFEFKSGSNVIHARAYADQKEEAHLTAIDIEDEQRLLSKSDLKTVLGRAAIHYFWNLGKTEVNWLDADNDVDGYSLVPPMPISNAR